MTGYVYIMTNKCRSVLYTGVTSNAAFRVWCNRTGIGSAFAARYRITVLVHLEQLPTMYEAICREKQIKGGSRARKIRLIEENNPEWKDLFDDL